MVCRLVVSAGRCETDRADGPPRPSELTSELVDPASTTLALGNQARLESQQHVPPAIDGRPPDAGGPSPDIH